MEQILNYIRILGNLKKYLQDEGMKNTIYYETVDSWYKARVDELKESCDIITTIRFIPFREFLQKQEAQINQNKYRLVNDYFKFFLEDFEFMLKNELDVDKRKHFEELYSKFMNNPEYFEQFKEYSFDTALTFNDLSETHCLNKDGKSIKSEQAEIVERKYSDEFVKEINEIISFINGKKDKFKEERVEL